MVNYWDISSNKDEHKVLVLSAASKGIIKCALIITPRFLTSSVAFAADSPKLLTFEQCQELIGATETIKVTSKTSKVVENF